MSTKEKKKKTQFWGTINENEPEPHYTAEQKKRIASYLKENDENCKESTTLILIIVIGLLVALSIVGFLAIRNNSAVKYKGAHTTSEHGSASNTVQSLSEPTSLCKDSGRCNIYRIVSALKMT